MTWRYGPRKGDDGFDAIGGNIDLAIDDYIAHNINYLRDVVGISLPPIGGGLRASLRQSLNRDHCRSSGCRAS